MVGQLLPGQRPTTDHPGTGIVVSTWVLAGVGLLVLVVFAGLWWADARRADREAQDPDRARRGGRRRGRPAP